MTLSAGMVEKVDRWIDPNPSLRVMVIEDSKKYIF